MSHKVLGFGFSKVLLRMGVPHMEAEFTEDEMTARLANNLRFLQLLCMTNKYLMLF